MIYTVGHTENYNRAINAEGEILKKGQRPGYTGGIVFRSRRDAARYLQEIGTADIWQVWGVAAVWGRDTTPTGNASDYWQWLIPDAFIFPLEVAPPLPVVPAELTVEHWFRKNKVLEHPNASHHFTPRSGLGKMLTIDEGDVSRKSFKRLHRWRYSPTAAYGNNEVHLHPYKPRRISAAEALAIQSMPPDMSLSAMFKTIGNGVPYLATSGIAKSLIDFLEQK